MSQNRQTRNYNRHEAARRRDRSARSFRSRQEEQIETIVEAIAENSRRFYYMNPHLLPNIDMDRGSQRSRNRSHEEAAPRGRGSARGRDRQSSRSRGAAPRRGRNSLTFTNSSLSTERSAPAYHPTSSLPPVVQQQGQSPATPALSRREALRLYHTLDEIKEGSLSQVNLDWLEELAARQPAADVQPTTGAARQPATDGQSTTGAAASSHSSGAQVYSESSDPPTGVKSTPLIEIEGELHLYDAHFHLHSRYKHMHTVPQLLNLQGISPKISLPIKGGLVNFCDPDEIP